MPRDSLQDTLFPVGGHTKPEVREIARSAGLPVAEKPESQEICFVPGNDYREVLRARTPDRLRPGSLVDAEGRRLGEHPGYQSFTIGQRRGIGVAAGKPVYVTAIDPATNTVTVGSREDLRRSEVDVTDVQWTSRAAPAPGEEVRVEAQIRHRATARPGTVTAGARGRAVLRFDEPQDAVTPGQAAVFYCGDVVLGGGWIEAAR
jgi:tRNA-specific 2-thiouridylase